MAGFHRYGNDYYETSPPDAARRVRRALGPQPLEDARHLLPPLALPAPPPVPEGPRPGTEFVVDLLGASPVDGADVARVLTRERLQAMGFPRLWGRPAGYDRWTRVDAADPSTRYDALALGWELAGLLTEDREDAAREMGGFAAGAARAASDLGRTAAPRDPPADAARRAERLLDLRARFGRSVEMRLLPGGRPFPARHVWRTAYALGLTWGDLDLFHWDHPRTRQHLFTVSALGQPGYFLPERAAEGEGTPGIALGFELPRSPAPVEVYDRMALALGHFRETLGGRPVTSDGSELDGDRLHDERDRLREMVDAMARAGIAPGSAEAAGFF